MSASTHALIQDAAYGTLLREARRDLYARIARTLYDNFPQTRETQPEILAIHYFERLPSGVLHDEARKVKVCVHPVTDPNSNWGVRSYLESTDRGSCRAPRVRSRRRAWPRVRLPRRWNQ